MSAVYPASAAWAFRGLRRRGTWERRRSASAEEIGNLRIFVTGALADEGGCYILHGDERSHRTVHSSFGTCDEGGLLLVGDPIDGPVERDGVDATQRVLAE